MASALPVCPSFCHRPPLCCSSNSSPDTPQKTRSSLPLSLESLSLSSSYQPLPSIVNPSLQFANIMWFNKNYNAQIVVGETEPVESVVRRFRKAVMQAGIISECRRRRFFETPQEAKKRKRQAAQRRRARRPRFFVPDKKEASSTTTAKDDDDDDWGYVEDA